MTEVITAALTPHKHQILNNAPAPNRGVSTDQTLAISNDAQPQDVWLKANGIKKENRVRLVKASHMRYQHPDLEEITTFLGDFGMHVVKATDTQRWFGGYGPDQYVYYAQLGPKKFLGGSFEVDSYAELEKIMKLPNAKSLSDGIEQLTDAPGGGYIVSIEDPEGFPVHFVWGQTTKTMDETMPANLLLNYETEKHRIGKFQRFQPGPAGVYKLGHFGFSLADCEPLFNFYTRNFNIVPSDILYLPGSGAVGTKDFKIGAMFGHIDRGKEFVDHHTFFMAAVPPGHPTHVHHSSYEVRDFDTQAIGHQWLADKGYELAWGLGRHILGSQIFDYWWDPTGFMVEHYADGDVVNEDTPVGFGPAGHAGLAAWGPEVPKTFLE